MSATFFVLTGGAVFSSRYRKSPVLVTLAAVSAVFMALVTYYQMLRPTEIVRAQVPTEEKHTNSRPDKPDEIGGSNQTKPSDVHLEVPSTNKRFEGSTQENVGSQQLVAKKSGLWIEFAGKSQERALALIAFRRNGLSDALAFNSGGAAAFLKLSMSTTNHAGNSDCKWFRTVEVEYDLVSENSDNLSGLIAGQSCLDRAGSSKDATQKALERALNDLVTSLPIERI